MADSALAQLLSRYRVPVVPALESATGTAETAPLRHVPGVPPVPVEKHKDQTADSEPVKTYRRREVSKAEAVERDSENRFSLAHCYISLEQLEQLEHPAIARAASVPVSKKATGTTGTNRPAWLDLPRVTCINCQHFTRDQLNPTQGIGRCSIGADTRGPVLRPLIERVCGQWCGFNEDRSPGATDE